MNIAERVEVVRKARLKYLDTEFEWGKNDCLRLARTVLIGCGAKGLPRLTDFRYSSELTALRRMKAAGYDCLRDILVDHCHEWPAAFGIAGDIGVIEPPQDSDARLEALVVRTDNGKWLGWQSETGRFGVLIIDPSDMLPVVYRARLL